MFENTEVQDFNKSEYIYYFARAATMKYHKLDGLNSRDLLSHSSGDQTSDNTVLPGFSSEDSHQQMAVFSIYVPVVFPLFFIAVYIFCILFNKHVTLS